MYGYVVNGRRLSLKLHFVKVEVQRKKQDTSTHSHIFASLSSLPPPQMYVKFPIHLNRSPVLYTISLFLFGSNRTNNVGNNTRNFIIKHRSVV
jgi:hypothetical protein